MTGAAIFRPGARVAAAESAAPGRGGGAAGPCTSAPVFQGHRRCARRRVRSVGGIVAHVRGAGPVPLARRPNACASGKRRWAVGPRLRTYADAWVRRRVGGWAGGGGARRGPPRLPAGTRPQGGSARMSFQEKAAGREVLFLGTESAGGAVGCRGRAALAALRAGLAAARVKAALGMTGGEVGHNAQRGSGAGRP